MFESAAVARETGGGVIVSEHVNRLFTDGGGVRLFHRAVFDGAFVGQPAKELLERAIPVRCRRWTQASFAEVDEERFDVFPLDRTDNPGVAGGRQKVGELADGLVVTLDRAGALVLGGEASPPGWEERREVVGS